MGLYTPEVHGLYHQMVARVEMKLELLPIEFFHQLTLRLKDEIELIVISKNSNVMAFGWCLHAAPSYHMLYAGLDYQFNPEFDFYFNLHYAALDRALCGSGCRRFMSVNPRMLSRRGSAATRNRCTRSRRGSGH